MLDDEIAPRTFTRSHRQRWKAQWLKSGRIKDLKFGNTLQNHLSNLVEEVPLISEAAGACRVQSDLHKSDAGHSSWRRHDWLCIACWAAFKLDQILKSVSTGDVCNVNNVIKAF